MKGFALIAAILMSSFFSISQNFDLIKLVDVKGKPVKEKKFKKEMQSADVVFFGEEHDNQVAHYMTGIYMDYFISQQTGKVSFVLEMFERDQQTVLDSINRGLIPIDSLAAYTRIWSNYPEDYAPLLKIAFANQSPIVASNVPREFASYLYKNGRKALIEKMQNDTLFLCDLNYFLDTTLSQYAALKEMALHMSNSNFVDAQALKDATMARSIADEVKKGNKVFHLNGRYHSDYQQGILWYLKKRVANINTLTISVVSTADGEDWKKEYVGKADYILLIPDGFPKSYQ